VPVPENYQEFNFRFFRARARTRAREKKARFTYNESIILIEGGTMPFTIDGQWVPSKPSADTNESNQKPVKVRLVKRGKSILTVILNLKMNLKEQTELASALKKKLGCGGAVKDGEIEIQGDKVAEVKSYLAELKIKSS
jgi:translation initiation factor 1